MSYYRYNGYPTRRWRPGWGWGGGWWGCCPWHSWHHWHHWHHWGWPGWWW